MVQQKTKHKVHVKTGDTVQIITGKDKGYVGEVIKVYPKENRLKVKGANIQTKHQKPTQANQSGGIIQIEGKIDASNVLLYCDKCGKGVKYKKQINDDGSKTRVCKKCDNVLDK